jgi:transcriptional regulator with XRE-family HTH domain
MAKNLLSQVRKSRGLTQRALAELAGTSQQQIQRIEAGTVSIRLELASTICSALNRELGEIFPALAVPKTRKKPRQHLVRREQLLEAGIDPDPAFWTVKFFSQDGREFLFYVPSDEKARLERIVRSGAGGFVVFSTHTHQVALNLGKFAATQFLFDFGIVDSPQEDSDDGFKLNLHLINTKDPIVFDVEPDRKSLDEDDDGSLSQLQNMFYYLEMDLEEDEVVEFDDVDGETVYLRRSAMLFLEVPLICCDPALWDAEFEGFLEDEEAKKANVERATK